MMDEKTYFKLIRRLPMGKCPENVVSHVLKAYNRPTGYKRHGFTCLTREMTYGLGCIIIITTMLIMGLWSYSTQTEYHNHIAVNSHLLVQQLANGLRF